MFCSFRSCFTILLFLLSHYVLSLSDAEIEFVRNTERNTPCINLGEICNGGCKGVFCNADNTSIAQILWDDEEIPALYESFSNLTGLVVLSLSNNYIEKIPPFGSLVNLEVINMTSNKLTSFPDITTLTKLQSLSLSENSLSELPEGITTLKSLSFFSVDDNCMDCSAVKSTLPKIDVECVVSHPEKCASSLSSSSDSSWLSSSSSSGGHKLGIFSWVALGFAGLLVVGVLITAIVVLATRSKKEPQKHGYKPITPGSEDDLV